MSYLNFEFWFNFFQKMVRKRRKKLKLTREDTQTVDFCCKCRWKLLCFRFFPPQTRATSLVYRKFPQETNETNRSKMADGRMNRWWMKCYRSIFSRYFYTKYEHRLGRLLLNRFREALSLKKMEVEQEKAPVSVRRITEMWPQVMQKFDFIGLGTCNGTTL